MCAVITVIDVSVMVRVRVRVFTQIKSASVAVLCRYNERLMGKRVLKSGGKRMHKQ